MLTFGVMFRPGHFPLSHVIACLKVAEDVGFDHAWFGDSHLIWHEVSPYLTAAAMSTRRLRVGPLVSNPVTRHPTLVASAVATLAELFDGRASLGVGRGDSAVRTLGLSPMKLGEFREALRAIRRLCRGETAEIDGTAVRFSWLTRVVPVLLAAYGPRVLELAGADADGVILQLASPSVIEWALPHARRGARMAGRTLDDFEVVAAAPTYVSADRERALAHVRGFPATVYLRHGHPDAPHATRVSDDMADRLTLIGTADAIRDKIRRLERAGVTHVCIYLGIVEPECHVSTLETYGREIIPHFR